MKNDTYLENTLMRGWEFLTGDYNFQEYGGSWVRKVNDHLYHVIELVNMHEATGDESLDKYDVELKEIDLENNPNNDAAISCCGFSDDMEITPIILVEAHSSYGSFAPMGSWNGNNYTKLLLSAKKESRNIDPNNGYNIYRAMQLARPVNLLGSTALEMGKGDFDSALIRGIAKGDPSAKLMGKIQGVDFSLISSDLQNYTAYPVYITEK